MACCPFLSSGLVDFKYIYKFYLLDINIDRLLLIISYTFIYHHIPVYCLHSILKAVSFFSAHATELGLRHCPFCRQVGDVPSASRSTLLKRFSCAHQQLRLPRQGHLSHLPQEQTPEDTPAPAAISWGVLQNGRYFMICYGILIEKMMINNVSSGYLILRQTYFWSTWTHWISLWKPLRARASLLL